MTSVVMTLHSTNKKIHSEMFMEHGTLLWIVFRGLHLNFKILIHVITLESGLLPSIKKIPQAKPFMKPAKSAPCEVFMQRFIFPNFLISSQITADVKPDIRSYFSCLFILPRFTRKNTCAFVNFIKNNVPSASGDKILN